MPSPESIFTNLKATSRKLTNGTPLDVTIVDANGNPITAFGGSGGTSDADGTSHVAGTTLGAPIQGVYESSPSNVADGKIGTVGMTTDRKLKVSGSFSSTPITAGTSSLSNVVEGTSSATVLAANANRLAFIIINDSDSALNLKFGSAASATSYSRRLLARDKLTTQDVGVNYTGIITGIWDTAPGTAGHDSARVTELTA